MKQLLKNIADKLPYVRTLKKKLVTCEEKLSSYESSILFPPGHFYSPLVKTSDILQQEERIFNKDKLLAAVDLNVGEQQMLLEQFKAYYRHLSFPDYPEQGKRYYYNNGAFSYADVIFLFSMMMHFRPKRIIEIGSGFSSAAMLDVNEQFFDNAIELTFIEPFPDTLKKLAKKEDRYTLLQKGVQDVELTTFHALEENDFLFIDSTHVAKTNSDVLFEMFEVLPQLKKGVKIHFHDIFYPFEYPRSWVVEENRSWNEIYLLRSFLMYNSGFKILSFNTFLEYTWPDWFKEHMPFCLENEGGSIWLEKIA